MWTKVRKKLGIKKVFGKINAGNEFILKKEPIKFGGIRKNMYLCTAFERKCLSKYLK